MSRPNPMTFNLGEVVATPGALAALQQAGVEPATLLHRHQDCDWGDVCAEDARSNNDALTDGGRLFSAYHITAGVKVWIITEATNGSGSRCATTILLPEEY